MAVKRIKGAKRKQVKQPRPPIAWKSHLRKAGLLLVMVTLISGGVYLQRDETFPILHVSVEGDFTHTDKEALVKAVSPYAQGGFMHVDVASIKRAGESLPWVNVVQVRRLWPDTLHLIVIEQEALALWGKNSLVNSEGQVFLPPINTIPSGLSLLEGPKGTNVLMSQHFKQMKEQLATVGLNLRSVRMDERRSWNLLLSNDVELILGRADSELRLQRFVQLYDGALMPYRENIARVDMRYTNGLSVTWKQDQIPDFNGTV